MPDYGSTDRVRRAAAQEYGHPPQPDSTVHTTSTIDSVLFDSLRGIFKETYKELGGAEAFFLAERESWGE